LFHRARRWNAQEGVWMGWERKRGKLAEFNRFLRGARGAFSTIVGGTALLRQVRYVITLDADTVLPPDAAPLLVGTLAHPLNRAVYDQAYGRVVRGYGILQPRVGVSLPSAHRSRFAAIHSGHPGVDPYTTAVSDVYQDLFGEGSFTGKGIYDVDVFEQATQGRFEENTLLSHDLIEGSYVRAGLATDVIVYDDYPPRYLTFTHRKHRWIRGDWQLLRWLAPSVPGPDGPEANRLSFLSRWKILDNLRRSTVEIGLLVLLLAGWTILPGSPLQWTALVLCMVAAPWIVSLILSLVRPPLDKSWRAYYAAVGRDTVTSARQVAIYVAFLAHQAIISADAIFRTLWRVSISRRHLLEWQTASTTERVMSASSVDVWRTMRPVTVLATAILVVAAGFEMGVYGGVVEHPDVAISPLWRRILAVLPLVGLWLASPAVAHALGRPLRVPEKELSSSGRRSALRYALLHWRFFDRFVSAETQWLAPDNFQEDPEPIIAMRTSPTNIGLQLLATTSAYDLGFVTAHEMTERLEQVFGSLERMKRFRGHFYNWYDLDNLNVLEPSYISTVDSGNLAGHLIALRQACLTIPDDPLSDGRTKKALATALALAEERLDGSSEEGAAQQVRRAREVLASPAEEDLDDVAEPVEQALRLVQQAGHDDGSSSSEWLEWVIRRIDAARKEEEMPISASDSGPPTLRRRAASSTAATTLVARLEGLAHRAYKYALEMDFRFLFDDDRKLFSIGYHVSGHTFDGAYYDLLASEARLTSFVAVAKNDVPVEHWFSLGRTLTRTAGETALVSWSGSMFEYLMPALVMRSFPVTLLSQTYRGAVRRQIAYAEAAGVPWGMSESAYNLRDRHLTYQYRAFGVPDLALKRGLGGDLVIAP
ncbi:MAG: glucoamylase family protein, partial [Rhodothermales bacterium]